MRPSNNSSSSAGSPVLQGGVSKLLGVLPRCRAGEVLLTASRQHPARDAGSNVSQGLEHGHNSEPGDGGT